jgi:hypothetical protein
MIDATNVIYKYTLNIIPWQLIFYAKTGERATVSKADSSCIENERTAGHSAPNKL